MQVTARVDYAVRTLLELAARPDERLTRDDIAEAQDIPRRYLEVVLSQLRIAGMVSGQRGAAGGYNLGRSPAQITVAEVTRAVDGPLTLVQGQRPEEMSYSGSSAHLPELWIGLRASLRAVLESVTIMDLLTGHLPASVQVLIDDPDAWAPRR